MVFDVFINYVTVKKIWST